VTACDGSFFAVGVTS